MSIGELVTVKTIENKNAFDEKHTPYSAEIRLLSCVQQGDIESLIKQLKNLDSIIVVGRMSDDELMQHKYMAVSTIAFEKYNKFREKVYGWNIRLCKLARFF